MSFLLAENAETPPSSTDGHVTLNEPRSPGSGSPHSNSGIVTLPLGANANSAVVNGSSKHPSRESSHHRIPGKHSKETKTTRVRTVLNEKQLATLRQCYGMNPRPDALMKEQLVDLTGLSPRVIRVWFQVRLVLVKKCPAQ